jgi:siderophore synthetase component
VSLDVQVTSTRRSISVASTRNGPTLSHLLAAVAAEGGLGGRALLMAETAGSAVVASAGRARDLAAIARDGLRGRLATGEVPVPGVALCATSPVTGRAVVAELVTRFARTRARHDGPGAALAFVAEYARLLLTPVLGLAARHGIALEAHLQNCVPLFVDGVPSRIAFRDFAGLRVYPPRVVRDLELWPGSVVVTGELDIMRAKLAYTALQAHLGEVVVRLAASHGLDEGAAWARVREIIDDVYDDLGTAAGRADHAFLTGPTLPHKALLRMRLAAVRGRCGDIYRGVENPLR